MRALALLISGLIFFPATAEAATGCTLIAAYPEQKILYESGDCDQRQPPASSFKIPLAVIGFDARLLTGAHEPSMPYKDEYKSGMKIQEKTTDPTIWMKDSIVWYSQQLTLKLGTDKFQSYVDQFDYGNKDLSGGLTTAWLGTSLTISPREQVTFLTKLLNNDLGVSKDATDKAMSVMPEFSSPGWRVFGKTGTSWDRDAKGGYDRTRPLGWFVGWADRDGRKIVFAKLVRGNEKWAEYGGPKARDEFLKELDALLPE